MKLIQKSESKFREDNTQEENELFKGYWKLEILDKEKEFEENLRCYYEEKKSIKDMENARDIDLLYKSPVHEDILFSTSLIEERKNILESYHRNCISLSKKIHSEYLKRINELEITYHSTNKSSKFLRKKFIAEINSLKEKTDIYILAENFIDDACEVVLNSSSNKNLLAKKLSYHGLKPNSKLLSFATITFIVVKFMIFIVLFIFLIWYYFFN